MRLTKLGALTAIAAISIGCATEAAPAEEAAPAVDDSTLDEQDDGISWNGWNHSVSSDIWYGWWAQDLSRSYGDSTRGAGACLAYYKAESCTSDTTCTTGARAQFGSSAYGYCVGGACWHRPGASSSYCTSSTNRSPGNYYGAADPFAFYVNQPSGYDYSGAVSCMTKTAGPNAGCGSTNSSLYVRAAFLLN